MIGAMLAALAAFFHGHPSAVDVCTPGYARAHRNVSYETRDRVYDRYGIPRGSRRGMRIDHRTPIELGGSNEESNLYPQPYEESLRKDADENMLHDEVCDGHMTLDEARATMLREWAR